MELEAKWTLNNRRLFKALCVFSALIPLIPDHILRVAESGISTRTDVEFAVKNGADAILVGEALVRGGDPARTMRTLLGQG